MSIREHIRDMIRGPAGKPEAMRTLSSLGTAVYILVTPIFQAIDVLWNKAHFDPLAFSTGYGSGFAAVLTAMGFAIGTKDKNVAKAQQINQGIEPQEPTS